jgi:hypothetical protein
VIDGYQPVESLPLGGSGLLSRLDAKRLAENLHS